MTYGAMQLHVERWRVYLFSPFSTAAFDIFLRPLHFPLSIASDDQKFCLSVQYPSARYFSYDVKARRDLSFFQHLIDRILLFFK